MNTIRHWWIQKPTRNNCPVQIRGAVFEEFEPIVRGLDCEWIKVFSSDDFHLKAGMGISRYSQVCTEKASLESRLAWAEGMLLDAEGLLLFGSKGTHRKEDWLDEYEKSGAKKWAKP